MNVSQRENDDLLHTFHGYDFGVGVGLAQGSRTGSRQGEVHTQHDHGQVSGDGERGTVIARLTSQEWLMNLAQQP